MAVAKENKIVRGNDLTYIGQQIKQNFVAKEDGKGLSTNDYTTAEKNKLAGIESGAQKNVKPDWNAASGSAAEILNKPTIPSTDSPTFTTKVSISSNSSNELTVQPNSPALLMGKYSGTNYTYSIPVATDSSKTSGTLALQSDIPTSTSALTNDSGFITADDIPAGVQPATAVPKMDGAADIGSSAKYAKEDHVHPSDSSKLNVKHPEASGVLRIKSIGSFAIDGVSYPSEIVEISPSEQGSRSLIEIKRLNTDTKKYFTELAFRRYWVSRSPVELIIPFPDNGSGTLALTSDITSAVSNKADKSTTLAGYGITNAYTKTEVDTAISNALKGGYTVVATLPTASADTMGKIYLVSMTDTEDDNVKEEYITYLDGSAYKWEKLGTTKFDNSDYEERLTAAEITTLLNL